MAELSGTSAASRRSERASDRRFALADLVDGAAEGIPLGCSDGASDFPLLFELEPVSARALMGAAPMIKARAAAAVANFMLMSNFVRDVHAYG